MKQNLLFPTIVENAFKKPKKSKYTVYDYEGYPVDARKIHIKDKYQILIADDGEDTIPEICFSTVFMDVILNLSKKEKLIVKRLFRKKGDKMVKYFFKELIRDVVDRKIDKLGLKNWPWRPFICGLYGNDRVNFVSFYIPKGKLIPRLLISTRRRQN